MAEAARRLRIAVVGHVEHVTAGRVPAVPGAGEIVHVASPRWFPGGGGGVAFLQFARSDAEVHFFTALGHDEAGDRVAAEVARAGGRLHAVRRAAPHTRCVAMIDPDGERTIVVLGEPHHPRADDPLPWDLLGSCVSRGSSPRSTAAPWGPARAQASATGRPQARNQVTAAAKLSPAPYAPPPEAAGGGAGNRAVPSSVSTVPPRAPSVRIRAPGGGA